MRYEAIAHELLADFQATITAARLIGQVNLPARMTVADIEGHEFTADIVDMALIQSTAAQLRAELTAPLDYLGFAAEGVGQKATEPGPSDVTGTETGYQMVKAFQELRPDLFRVVVALVANPDGMVTQLRAMERLGDDGLPTFDNPVASRVGVTGRLLAEAVLA